MFREGYGLRDLQRDALAGLTVAIVALSLSMAIAIASGVSPDRGLYTAIVGGFVVSLLGGSRFQIAGPAGAFIALVAGIVERHGYDGLALATIMAGLMMLALGLLRGGTYIKYIPFPVTVGFTAGIAVIIFARQVKDAIGAGSLQVDASAARSDRAECFRAPSDRSRDTNRESVRRSRTGRRICAEWSRRFSESISTGAARP